MSGADCFFRLVALRKKLRKTAHSARVPVNSGASKPQADSNGGSQQGAPQGTAARPPAREPRGWGFRLMAILSPVLLLGILELGLRLAGYGYPTSFFSKTMVEGRECLVENRTFSRLFFPASLARVPAPFTMEANKAAGTFRIFIFGESAAEGDPRPQLSAGRYLKALLQERFRGQRFEVINTAITAINSHAILPIARECAAYQGDFWVVYMGNNEMIGPFGAATVFGRRAAPAWFVRLNLAIQRLRVGQLLKQVAGSVHGGSSAVPKWEGMEMFLRNTLSPSDPRKEVVYGNFRHNLEDMLHAGTASGARIVLSTVAVNLKDCPPFASENETSLEEAGRAAFNRAWAEAEAAREHGDAALAVQRYGEAAKTFPQSASAHYLLATSLLAVSNVDEAKREFELARDDDTLCFRADSRLNSNIVEIAGQFRSKGVALCDAAGALAASSPDNVPGREYFYEHVHPNCEGNYALGLAWAKEIAALMPAAARQQEASAWASEAACDGIIGATDWNRAPVIQEVIERLRQPPLSTQFGNSNRVAALQSQLAALRSRTAAADGSAARAVYEEALRRAPEDYMVHGNYAEFLEATGDFKEALAQRRLVAKLTPQDYFSHYKLGRLLRDQRELPGAEQAFRAAVRLNPDQDEVRLQLGAVCALQKKFEPALAEFEAARRLAPGDPRPLLFAGEALWELKRARESLDLLREATRLKPDYADAHYQLGEELALSLELPEAAAEFQTVLRLKPTHLRARLNLAVALSKMGRAQDALRECDEALRIDPGNKQALQLRQNLVGGATPRTGGAR